MTVFDTHEQQAFEQATKLQLTQAIVVSIDEEREGQYQCRVLPDLVDLDDEKACPWYPALHTHEKLDLAPNDVVWLYVSQDLGVGYVWCKINTIADMVDKQAEIRDRLTEPLKAVEDANVDLELDYNSLYYAELFEGTFIFFDREKGTVGFTNNEATVAVQSDQIFMHGDIQQQGSVTHEGDNFDSKTAKASNLTSDGNVEISSAKTAKLDGSAVEINGASKSFVTYSELDNALQSFKSSVEAAINTAAASAITNHTHISPFMGAPTAPGIGAPTVPPIVLVTSPAQTVTVKTGG